MRERDTVKIAQMIGRLAKEPLADWERRTQAEFEERARKAKEESNGRRKANAGCETV